MFLSCGMNFDSRSYFCSKKNKYANESIHVHSENVAFPFVFSQFKVDSNHVSFFEFPLSFSVLFKCELIT